MHPEEAKIDARDTAIIVEATRSLPLALRSIQLAEEQVAELSMLYDFDDEIVAQATPTISRTRGLSTQIHPALPQVIDPHLDHPAVLDLVQKCQSPAMTRNGWYHPIGQSFSQTRPEHRVSTSGRTIHWPTPTAR